MVTDLERLSARLKACKFNGDCDAMAAELLAQNTGVVPRDWLSHCMQNAVPMMVAQQEPGESPSTPKPPVFDLASCEQKLGQRYVDLGFGNDASRLASIRLGQRNQRLTPLKVQFGLAMGEDLAAAKLHLGKAVKT